MQHLHSRAWGNTGEDIACKYLYSKGFEVIVRNYRKVWGELDIIALKDDMIHFFEVKSVTWSVAAGSSGHRPEENVHGFKVRQIRRMIQTYLRESEREAEVEFQFHVLCVYMNAVTRHAKVKWIENIILT